MEKSAADATRYRLFVMCAPGLEPLLDAEIRELLPETKVKSLNGGLEIVTSRFGLWLLCERSRIAEAVRLRLARFEAKGFNTLQARLKRINWSAYLTSGARVRIRVHAKKSAMYHSGAVAERARQVLVDRLSVREPVKGVESDEDRAEDIFIRLRNDRVTVSLSASGEGMYRKGYRLQVGQAPLRETLAAACVRAAELSLGQALWDPFCGSGTLLLEALGASGPKPRRFAFQSWPTHKQSDYQEMLSELPSAADELGTVGGSDRDGKEVAAARKNSETAGLSDRISLRTSDVAGCADLIPQGAAVVTNLPYGHRTQGGPSLQRTLADFSALVKRRTDLKPVVALSSDPNLPAKLRLEGSPLVDFPNRGQGVTLFKLR
jgi:putative N6-adenine-specific DNA methylase